MLDVLQSFLDVAARRGSAMAVIDGEARWDYASFAKLVRRYAAEFARSSSMPKILINLDAGAYAYAAMFGSLMAGGHYAPVNIEHPLELRRKIANALRPDVVVSSGKDDEARILAGDRGRVLRPDALGDDELATARPACEVAYVMFTSGSTGVPKGVMISRNSLNAYIQNVVDEIRPGVGDVWSQYANIGFDFSIFDIYGALSSGGALCALSSPIDRLTPALAVKKYGITIWASVPSVVDIMSRARSLKPANLASLRLMLFCGEPLLQEHLRAIYQARPDVAVWNTYGPTEATVFVTILKLSSADYPEYCRGSVAIGRAIPHSAIHIWNEESGAGVDEGELILCGEQLALGYIGDEAGTARAFRRVHIDGRPVRAYFTGDWVRRDAGQIYFVNRIDRQIKLNGYRIELGSIDSALRAQGFSSACTVVVDNAIVSFVESDTAPDAEAMRAILQKTVPSYMVPKHVYACSVMPTNMNGKVDVKALTAKAEELLRA